MYTMLTRKVNDANRRVSDTKRMDSMSARIRGLREARGMTQTDLARLVGVTRGAVAQWELGIVDNIKLQTFLKLCDVLGTDPQYLVHGSDRGHAKARPKPGGTGAG